MNDRGFSAVEMLMTLAIAGIVLGIGVYNMRDLDQAAQDGANQFAGFIRRARAKAMGTTYAYTITASSSKTVITTFGISCDGAQTSDPLLAMSLSRDAQFVSTTWSICFTPRGITEDSADIVISDNSESKTVQVAAGGGTRIQ